MLISTMTQDTAANWTSLNPVLLKDEGGYETDTGKFKIGNGTTPWNSLAYHVSGAGPLPPPVVADDSDKLDGLDSTAFLLTTGKAADSHLLDGVDSTGFLRSNGKAVDSELLDGIDSSGFLRRGDPPNGVQDGVNTKAVTSLNARLASGWYDGSGMTGAPDGNWWLVQVIAHSNGAHWQRQIAYSMTTESANGGQSVYSRRCNGGDPTVAASWSTWESLNADYLHYVSTGSEPGFLNGWSNWGSGWNQVGFWREGETIHLQGLARAGTQGSAIFYLPVGYRPTENSHHPLLSALGLGDLHVYNTGEVRHRDALGNDPAWVSLDGVSFRRA